MGYFAGANILMEYVLSNAGVARSFTEYLCCAFGENDPNSWRVEVNGLMKGYNTLDFPAVALIILLTLCLCHRFDFSNWFLIVILLVYCYSFVAAYINHIRECIWTFCQYVVASKIK